MTTLRCVCGVVVEGSGAELLEAVERHVREEHTSDARGVEPFALAPTSCTYEEIVASQPRLTKEEER